MRKTDEVRNGDVELDSLGWYFLQEPGSKQSTMIIKAQHRQQINWMFSGSKGRNRKRQFIRILDIFAAPKIGGSISFGPWMRLSACR